MATRAKQGGPLELATELSPSVPYYLGSGIEDALVQALREVHFDKLFVVTDAHVERLHGERLLSSLAGFKPSLLVIPHGEPNKNFRTLAALCEQLVERGASKESLLIAFGGGVVGNVVGLTAALLYRGVRFIELPTTFMAQTDSTLSNKQAVNGDRGKNLFGVYHAPIAVWVDVRYLATEAASSIRSGLVESVKNGMISDPAFLGFLDRFDYRAGSFPLSVVEELVYRSVLSKLKVIRRDPSEKASGVMLEYGHTFGHAIEKLSDGAVSHGQAVAKGMRIAAALSRKLGYLDAEGVEQHEHFLHAKLGIDLSYPRSIGVEQLMDAMSKDNKKTAQGVRYVLLRDIGEVLNVNGDYLHRISPEVVEEVVASRMGA